MRVPYALPCLLAGAIFLIAGPALAYEVASVGKGGKIKGKVVYNGTVETRTVLPTKDEKVCGGPREEPVIRVGVGNGVEDSVVYLEKVAKGKAWPSGAPAPTVDNKECRFLPHVQAIQAGKLGVLNSDPVLHNTHGYYGRRTAFNLALPNQGQRIDVTLERPGTVRLDCDAHGWMEGWVYVLDNPYYAITGADGTFEISDVPPGQYTLIANQEAMSQPVDLSVEVKAGETVEVPIELKP